MIAQIRLFYEHQDSRGASHFLLNEIMQISLIYDHLNFYYANVRHLYHFSPFRL